jgi:hypothetical protein
MPIHSRKVIRRAAAAESASKGSIGCERYE